MNNSVEVIKNIFIYFAVFSISILLICYFFTRKFNSKYRKIYILFMGLSFREVFLIATTFISAILMIYFIINNEYYWPLGMYMITANCFLSCLFSLNYRVIIVDIIYTSISCCFLWLLMVIIKYYLYVGGEKYILSLILAFIIMIVVYTLFVATRKMNLLINIHKTGGKK